MAHNSMTMAFSSVLSCEDEASVPGGCDAVWRTAATEDYDQHLGAWCVVARIIYVIGNNRAYEV